jgi:hypothetical protein
MHSGFGLRSLCPMNIEAQLQETGARLWAEMPICAAMSSSSKNSGPRC